MKIMITGATGFIGSELIKKLTDQGNYIHALCRSSSNVEHLLKPNIKLFLGDILDQQSIANCMDGCEQIYHLAAYAKNYAKSPNTFFDSNNNAVRMILNLALEKKVKKVLVMSTSMTFGPSNHHAVNEDSTRSIQPLTFYEASKIEAEKTVSDFLGKGLEIVIVNPTRLFGPGLITEGNSVTKMIQLYLSGKFRLILGDGNSVGNYAFISDVVDGCINAMNKGRDGARYILGGENLSYNQFFAGLKDLSGKKYRMIHVPVKAGLLLGEAEELLAKISNHYPKITPDWVKTFALDWAFSSDKAVDEIEYRITPFTNALSETLSWIYLNNKNGR
jgi:nucleoside-diphosphate-sugar epimerase